MHTISKPFFNFLSFPDLAWLDCFLIHENIDATVSADGILITGIDNVTVDCK
jgi:hypothetical protein